MVNELWKGGGGQYRMEKLGAGEEFLTKEKVQWAEAGDRSRSITPKPHMLYFAFSTFDFISILPFLLLTLSLFCLFYFCLYFFLAFSLLNLVCCLYKLFQWASLT